MKDYNHLCIIEREIFRRINTVIRELKKLKEEKADH